MRRRLYTTQRLAYDEYFLLLLSGRSPSMAMMMMTIICCRGLYEAAALLILPFFGADCRHLIPIRPASARAQQQPSQMCDTHPADFIQEANGGRTPYRSIIDCRDLLRSIAFLFFCRSTLIYRTASQAVSLSHQ
jgi:hypothetical protein